MNLQRFFNRPVVMDASVLFDFYEINALYVLNTVFSKIYIPTALMGEIVQDEQLRQVKGQLDYEEIVFETVEAYELFDNLSKEKRMLSVNDRHLICTAYEKGFLCASNDGLVSKACRELNIDNPRTLGILGCARLMAILDKEKLIMMFNKIVSDECSSFLTINSPVALDFARWLGIDPGKQEKV